MVTVLLRAPTKALHYFGRRCQLMLSALCSVNFFRGEERCVVCSLTRNHHKQCALSKCFWTFALAFKAATNTKLQASRCFLQHQSITTPPNHVQINSSISWLSNLIRFKNTSLGNLLLSAQENDEFIVLQVSVSPP